jgi:hypothetical protein
MAPAWRDDAALSGGCILAQDKGEELAVAGTEEQKREYLHLTPCNCYQLIFCVCDHIYIVEGYDLLISSHFH